MQQPDPCPVLVCEHSRYLTGSPIIPDGARAESSWPISMVGRHRADLQLYRRVANGARSGSTLHRSHATLVRFRSLRGRADGILVL